jgi:hypothetical protein
MGPAVMRLCGGSPTTTLRTPAMMLPGINLVAAGRDDQSETAEYLTGWQDAKERMFREVQMDCGGCGTPRATTAMLKPSKTPMDHASD